ncbi:DNA/RNA non-specific endonuclease [Streptomyces sp. NPDC057271]
MLAGQDTFSPDQTPDTQGAPGTDPGPGAGGQQDDPRDCRTRGQQRIDYGTLDSDNGNRPTGITACLDKSRLQQGSEAKRHLTKGYLWAQDFVESHGFDRSGDINACHLFAGTLGGDGAEPKNLSACARPANAYYTKGSIHRNDKPMRYYEAIVKKEAQKTGVVVEYKVTPKYDGPRTVPYEYRIDVTTWHNGVRTKLFEDAVVENEFKPSSQYNLGRQTDADGNPVPTGNTK